MSEWVGLLSDVPGWLSLIFVLKERWKRWKTPKPDLEVLSVELQPFVGGADYLIITINNKSNKQIATGLRCVWFIQEEGVSESIDSSTNRPNRLKNITKVSKQKPVISKSDLPCDPNLHTKLKTDAKYLVMGEVTCTQLREPLWFNLPLKQLPKIGEPPPIVL